MSGRKERGNIETKVRDTHKQQFGDHWNNPQPKTLYLATDFKEHITLPIGPDEKGDWWYAGSRPVMNECNDISL